MLSGLSTLNSAIDRYLDYGVQYGSGAIKRPDVKHLPWATPSTLISLKEEFRYDELHSPSWVSVSTRSPSSSTDPRSFNTFDFCLNLAEDENDDSGDQLNGSRIHRHDSVEKPLQVSRPVSMCLGCPDGSLGGFYGLMRHTRDLRMSVAQRLFSGGGGNFRSDSRQLQDSLALLESIPRPQGWAVGDDEHQHLLVVDSDTNVVVRLEYEKNELRRDIRFLEGGECALLSMMREKHETGTCPEPWTESIQRAIAVMRVASSIERAAASTCGKPFRNFITDRDGTINNYCDRYASSVQSTYNAAWIGEFAMQCVEMSLFLTSAPLGGQPSAEGMVDLCTMPPGLVTYAGSKGRVYFDHTSGQVTEVEPLPSATHELLRELHRRLHALCVQRNSKFLGIGSGLQRKFGEVTMARNDPTKSVPHAESHRFMVDVLRVVSELDPEGTALGVHDTGTDMEISPRVAGGCPSFSKCDGVIGLDRRLGLRVADGPNLVCGDTASDVPMIEACLRLMKADGGTSRTRQLAVLFVVTPEQRLRTPELPEQVVALCEGAGAPCAILPSSDVLVAALAQFSRETVGVGTLSSTVGRG